MTRPCPNSSKVSLTCLRCDKPLVLLKPHLAPSPADRDMWDDAVVHTIHGGFGSTFDTSTILIGVCDACLRHHVESGGAVSLGSFLDQEPDDAKPQ